MTGDILELQKQSFWKEHQDTLVRLRHRLVSGKGSRSKHRNVNDRISQHPPLGKYRRTPSPYLSKLNLPASQCVSQVSSNKFEVVPPLRPRLAFKPADDFDSWGEESDDESDDYAGDISDRAVDGLRHNRGHAKAHILPHRHHQYRPHPHMPTHPLAAATHTDPVHVYYPPPPKRKNQGWKHTAKRNIRRKHPHQPQLQPATQHISHGVSHGVSRNKRDRPTFYKVPVTSRQAKMSATATVLSPASETEEGEEEEEEEENEKHESLKAALQYWQQHPMFASDFTDWFIQECLHTELCPDFMVDTFKEMQHMPYDHPLYMPSLNCCEDIVTDHVSEMMMELVIETVAEAANDYLDEQMLQRDPVEDFLAGLLEDVVIVDTRESVRLVVLELAEEYLQTQCSIGVINLLLDDFVKEIGPELLDDVIFDLTAEEFIRSEVIGPEVLEEAGVIAREMVQFYDNKVKGMEFKEVGEMAEKSLADVVMMELVLSLMSQQGSLWTEEEHLNRYLDGVMFYQSVSHMISVTQERDRTLYCKPLHKLHEKTVSDVALDVFLQQLTWSLDEDLADVDEYERGVTDGAVYPIFQFAR